MAATDYNPDMRILWVSILLLLLGGYAGWQAESRAAIEQRLLLRTLVAQAEPWGTVSYGKTVAHFWGSGRIENFHFVPGEALRTRYDLPAGLAVSIPKLRYADWQAGARWPRGVHCSFEVLSLTLPEPLPSLFSGTADWDYTVDTGALTMALKLAAPNAAAIESTVKLRLRQPQTFSQAVLIAARLHYQDQGLAQGARATLASRLGADPKNADSALAHQLGTWLSQRGLPPDADMQTALRAFASEPRQLTVRFDPPGSLRPETLPLFAPTDRAAALGVGIELN